MQELELLAPARNAQIGIAAIDCGADAVYIAGPLFGARAAAGNSVEDVRTLCAYAHRFGARVFVAFNTIIREEELFRAKELFHELEEAGADAFIVQDLSVLSFGSRVPLHASTQCAIRTPAQARFYASLGFSRLVLERQLSLAEVEAIRSAVDCELEFFVHGALCVCYSGDCYLSEYLTGRSANRGACAQACRSRYDLLDESGRVLLRDKAVLSLKDYNLLSRVGDLATAGICSFKIEGRLKNVAYVRNTVRAYSDALDRVVVSAPSQWCRSSRGVCQGGFTPNLDRTFNRGYTQLYLDGRRGQWAAMEAPKAMGEKVGQVSAVRMDGPFMNVTLKLAHPGITFHNGDGFAFVRGSEIVGWRADVCQGNTIRSKAVEGLRPGTILYRNLDTAFEQALEREMPRRLIRVSLRLAPDASAGAPSKTVSASLRPFPQQAVGPSLLCDRGWSQVLEGAPAEAWVLEAVSEDGRTARVHLEAPVAEDRSRMASLLAAQLSKTAACYQFSLESLPDGPLPFMPASALNAARRNLAAMLDEEPCRRRPLFVAGPAERQPLPADVSYKQNIANSEAAAVYAVSHPEPAYELTHRADAELMRTRYCVRYEMGLCPKFHHSGSSAPLYLVNNGRRLILTFDCPHCEMTVRGE